MPRKSPKTDLHTEPSAQGCRSRLARECAKLDPVEEKAVAEEGMAVELAQWPEYGANEPGNR
jgi:hypothetical protein